MRQTLLLAGSALALAMASTSANAQSNDAYIEQVGANNTAYAHQEGFNNRALVRQTSDENAVGYNEATGAAQTGNNNDALFTQSGGPSNWASAPVTGNGNEVFVRQNGQQNSYSGALRTGNSDDVLVLQNGNRNLVEDAAVQGGNNTAVFIQNGNRNYTVLNGSGYNAVNGIKGGVDRSYGSIQVGTNNRISGFQPTTASELRAGNSLPASSTGTYQLPPFDINNLVPEASLLSELSNTPDRGVVMGDRTFAPIHQRGDNNTMALQVTGGNDNTVVGSGSSGFSISSLRLNTASAGGLGGPAGQSFNDFRFDGNPFLTAPGGATIAAQIGDGNAAALAVEGYNNMLVFDQLGYDNAATVVQNGNFNTGAAIQNGDNNSLVLASFGNNNSNIITQIGNNNTASAVQRP